jgi:hypothetical protein
MQNALRLDPANRSPLCGKCAVRSDEPLRAPLQQPLPENAWLAGPISGTVLPAVRQLREELQLLQEPGSYVGEVIKVMGKKKVLCKVGRAS